MAVSKPSSVIAFPDNDFRHVTGLDAGRNIVWLQGEYDISTVSALSQTMDQTGVLGGGDLVVDLSGVRFMDASTIGVIIRSRNKLRSQHRSLTLRSPSTSAGRILGLCGLTDLFDPPPVDANATRSTRALNLSP
jgi:anti-anti-sigma factor